MSAEMLSGMPFLLRRHNHGMRYGDEWRYSLVVEIEGNIAHVKGLRSEDFCRDDFELIARLCKKLGAKSAIYERMKNGKFIKKTVIL